MTTVSAHFLLHDYTPTSTMIVRYKASSIGCVSDSLRRKLLSAARNGLVCDSDWHGVGSLEIVYPSRITGQKAPNRSCGDDLHARKPTKAQPGWKALQYGLRDLEPFAPHNRRSECTAYLYAGSHNLSSSAWEKGYECGVVMRLLSNHEHRDKAVKIHWGMYGAFYPVDRMWADLLEHEALFK
jgi:hypothetical protein